MHRRGRESNKSLHLIRCDADPARAAVEPRIVDAPFWLVHDFDEAVTIAASSSVEAFKER